MPCYDPRSSESYTSECHKQEVDYFTRMLCAACKQIEAAGATIENPETLAWWIAHKAADQAREQREQEERKAYEKTQQILEKAPVIFIPGVNWP